MKRVLEHEDGWYTKESAIVPMKRVLKVSMRQYNVGRLFERIVLDVAGPFPMTDDGNKYIMVV